MKDHSTEYSSALAYYQRRWVSVPLRYIPKEAGEDEKRKRRIARYKNSEAYQGEFGPIPTRTCKFYDSDNYLVRESLVPDLLSKQEVKDLFIVGNISRSWIDRRFFTEENDEQKSDEKNSRRQQKVGGNRRTERCVQYLKKAKFEKFLLELKELSKKSRLGRSVVLITKLLWELNKSPGNFYTLQEVLYLEIVDVSPETDSINWIRLHRRRGMQSHTAVLSLPKGLYKEICKQITDDSPLVFSNRYGGPLTRKQVDEYLRKAGKLAGFDGQKIITSLSLRPPFDEEASSKCYVDALVKEYLTPISSEEFDVLCKKVPDLLSRRGRKPQYHSIDMLNVILCYLRGCPVKKLPTYPPWEAVRSQYRRWKTNGVLEEILHLRKKK